MDSFSFILFLRQSHLGLNMCYFITFTLIRSRDVQFGFYLRRWRRNVWRRIDVNMTSIHQKWRQNCHPDVMHESCLRHPRLRQHFLAPVVPTEIPVGCARKIKHVPNTVNTDVRRRKLAELSLSATPSTCCVQRHMILTAEAMKVYGLSDGHVWTAGLRLGPYQPVQTLTLGQSIHLHSVKAEVTIATVSSHNAK